MNEEIDHGDVMGCLADHKDAEEMTPKCRTYVNHFELISLRDYHFNYRFTQACQEDIKQNCAQFGQDKYVFLASNFKNNLNLIEGEQLSDA